MTRLSPQKRETAPLRARAAARVDRREEALADILDELERATPELAERMLKQYLDSIPSYRALPDVTLDQIREVNRANVIGFIRALRERRGPSPEELTMIRESAKRRAREGVPLSSLLAAYRAGAQIAWGEARMIIGDDPERLSVGLDFATAVMSWMDEASGAAAQAYLAEYERLASDLEASRRDFLDGVLGGDLTGDEILARGEALGLDPAVSYAVSIVSFVHHTADDGLLRTTQHRLRTMSADLPGADRSLVVARGPELVLVLPSKGTVDEQAGQLTTLAMQASEAGAELCAGLGRARESLTELAASHREASIALAAARAGSTSPVAVYGEVLIEELILRERAVARRLAQTILEPLNTHPDLRETLVEYMRHGPSLPAVAKRLYLHPNTVAYRLARVRDLTGRDPKSPAGVAELFLALRASQLVGDEQPETR
ncbi:MAG: PucR family transcriptional regulator [Actinomycetota bacterium]